MVIPKRRRRKYGALRISDLDDLSVHGNNLMNVRGHAMGQLDAFMMRLAYAIELGSGFVRLRPEATRRAGFKGAGLFGNSPAMMTMTLTNL